MIGDNKSYVSALFGLEREKVIAAPNSHAKESTKCDKTYVNKISAQKKLHLENMYKL